MKSSEKKRIQICMIVSNSGIASVLFDSFGRTATEIMSYLLEHTASCPQTNKRRARAKSYEIIEEIRGYNIGIDRAKRLNLPMGIWNILTIWPTLCPPQTLL